jgi:hypothetical protein
MADDAGDLNRLELAGPARSTTPGDAPAALVRRYLLDPRGGPGLGFYLDATSKAAVFRDRGDRLTTGRNDPTAIRHMAEIARHRGWETITVRGDTGFRREAWLAAGALGLEVRGYRPTLRDEQDLARRIAARPRGARRSAEDERHLDTRARAPATATDRLQVAERVVRARVDDPAEGDRILAATRERLARWLERGATFDPVRPPERPTVQRDRGR